MRHPGKDGTIERARELRRNATKTERLLWWKLKELNRYGHRFRRQVPLRGYFLDFADHSNNIAIELDGDQHGESENLRHDSIGDRVIGQEGYCIVRFWNFDLLRDLEASVSEILQHMVRCSRHISPTRFPPRYGAAETGLPTRGRWYP